jgi:membrane protein YdbS with pleckstrin-like domain
MTTPFAWVLIFAVVAAVTLLAVHQSAAAAAWSLAR